MPIEELDIHPNHGRRVARSSRFKRLRHKIIPRHTYLQIKLELRMAWLRLRSAGMRKRFLNATDLLVNLGPGSHGKPGWINLDAFPAPHVNCLYDCRKSLPFPDRSVRGIFCEHFVEHLDYTEEIPSFLSECGRVLKPGGVFRVIVPDAEKYLRAYGERGWDHLARVRGLDSNREDPYHRCRYNTRMELINVVFRQGHEHKFAYDFETLEFLLRRYGFSSVIRQEFGKSTMSGLCLDRAARASESLYIEAVR